MEKAHDLFVAMMYKSEIPGMPHKDYPIYADIPNTQFRCAHHSNVGYYADVETGCQVYALNIIYISSHHLLLNIRVCVNHFHREHSCIHKVSCIKTQKYKTKTRIKIISIIQ